MEPPAGSREAVAVPPARSREAGAVRKASLLTLREALERLQGPDVFEDHSPLLGVPVFAVDLSAEAEWPDEMALAIAREALVELPCPCIGFAEGVLAPAADALRQSFDCLVETREDLETVVAAIVARPFASQALVQLLRLSAHASLHDGLVAESMAYSTLQSGPEFAAWLDSRGAPRERPEPERPPVRVERSGSCLELTLDRPEKRNAFSARMRDALCEALAVAVWDRSVERVVLRGEGPSFSSGGDLDEFGTLPDPATAHAVRATRHPGRLLHALAGRTEVFVQGACVGAGVELPAFSGRVVARPDASFQLPEISMGLVPGAGGTASLPRRIGRQRCAWLALSGARLDAETALDWHLVDAIEA